MNKIREHIEEIATTGSEGQKASLLTTLIIRSAIQEAGISDKKQAEIWKIATKKLKVLVI